MSSWADLRTGGAPVLQKPADFGWQDQLWPSCKGVGPSRNCQTLETLDWVLVPVLDCALAECLR